MAATRAVIDGEGVGHHPRQRYRDGSTISEAVAAAAATIKTGAGGSRTVLKSIPVVAAVIVGEDKEGAKIAQILQGNQKACSEQSAAVSAEGAVAKNLKQVNPPPCARDVYSISRLCQVIVLTCTVVQLLLRSQYPLQLAPKRTTSLSLPGSTAVYLLPV